MRLPSFIYENMPYFYFAASGVCLSQTSGLLLNISAALFYFAGAMIWCMRSSARRRDMPSKHAKAILNIRLSDSLYELMPFLHIGVAIVLFKSFEHAMVMFVSFGLTVYAMQNLVMRILNRKKANTELAYGKRRAAKKSK